MAARNGLAHNPNLQRQVRNWFELGENVGVGASVADIQRAFMRSPSHRANILDPAYTEIGVGAVRDGRGMLWVTQDFRRPYTVSHAPVRAAFGPRPPAPSGAVTQIVVTVGAPPRVANRTGRTRAM